MTSFHVHSILLDPLVHFGLDGELDISSDDCSEVLGLGVEHDDSVELVLHSHKEELRMFGRDNVLVKWRVEDVLEFRPNLMVKKAEFVLVTGTLNDGVILGRSAVGELN